jgi:hypothetical protein
MDNLASWVATVATILAACMTASNLGSRITGYGFAVFTIGSIAWLAVGALTGQPALVWTNIVMTILNLFGIWRWLGRQAKVEEGAKAAAEASENTPGEALFPISMLTRAPLRGREGELGTCVDAMAGCTSGRIAYAVVAQGGIAGVGETLRKVPWSKTHFESDRLAGRMDLREFEQFERVERDHWPLG